MSEIVSFTPIKYRHKCDPNVLRNASSKTQGFVPQNMTQPITGKHPGVRPSVNLWPPFPVEGMPSVTSCHQVLCMSIVQPECRLQGISGEGGRGPKIPTCKLNRDIKGWGGVCTSANIPAILQPRWFTGRPGDSGRWQIPRTCGNAAILLF